MSDKTCDNCDIKDLCKFKDMMGGICNLWQPIPVATTDVKSNVPWHHMGEPNGMYNPDGSIRTWTSDVEWYRGAIAKRDDLIRRMVKQLKFWTGEIDVSPGSVMNIITEADELMGVK